MGRVVTLFSIFTFIMGCFMLILPVAAHAKSTSDINHQGWYEVSGEKLPHKKIQQVMWKDVQSDCEPCKYLVMEYNFAMQEVLRRRYLVKLYREMQSNQDENYVELFKDQSNVREGGELGAAGIRIGEILERAEKDKSSRDWSEANVKIAENRAQRLRELIADCEKQCTGGKTTKIKIGGQPEIKGTDPKGVDDTYEYTPPKWWKGPFDSVCWKCEKLAKELNERIPHEIKIREIEMAHRKRLEKDLANEYEDGKMASTLQAEIYRLEDHYKKTLKLYNDCIKTCNKKTACAAPKSGYKAITVGANDQVGSGAQFENAVKDQAKGMAMGAIGGLLGGSGVSLGGGGSGQKGPKLDKDPTAGSRFNEGSFGGVDFGVRGGFNGDGQLVVSFDLDDVPGDGTFHAQWIEDSEGHIYRPVRYLIFELYQDWKLTVWWTEDRYVDGEHVYHDEGEEITYGRNELGTFALRFAGEKGIENSIWHMLGFETAVKGVKRLGTVYDIPDEVLGGPCPLRLVTHVTEPKKDPVTTIPLLGDIPMMGELFRGRDSLPKKNLQILVTPQILDAAEE